MSFEHCGNCFRAEEETERDGEILSEGSDDCEKRAHYECDDDRNREDKPREVVQVSEELDFEDSEGDRSDEIYHV